MTRILIIDDDEMVSRVLREGLTQAGFEAEAASDGSGGFKAATDRHPDLILLDVQLPEMNGIDLIRFFKMHEQLKRIPIIMLTGTHHQSEHKVKAMTRGADDYVLKPFDMPELIARIQTVLRRSAPQETAPTAALPMRATPSSLGAGRQGIPAPANSAPVLAAQNGSAKGHALPSASAAKPAAFVPADLGALIERTLRNPWGIGRELQYPRLAPTYLLCALALTFLGVAFTAGSPIRPLVAGLWVASTWGVAVATLVMCCSIMGLHLTWKEGAYLISLSGIPVLIKIAGGAIVAFLISLSPFYFTAGPALFWRGLPWLMGRLDPFEIWSAALLWIFIRRWSGGNTRRAWIATATVWLACAGMAAALSMLMEPGAL